METEGKSQTLPPVPQVQEKTPWELNPEEFARFLEETIPEEIDYIKDQREKRKENLDVVQAMNVFIGSEDKPGLVKLITRIAIDQISHPSGLSWEQLSPEGVKDLRTNLKYTIPDLQENNPAMARTFELVAQELLALPGGDIERMNRMALKLEDLAWEGYSANKPVVLFLYDGTWVNLMCSGKIPSWDVRAILMKPVSLDEQLALKDWGSEVVSYYQQSFPDLDLKQLEQIRLFMGENVAHAGTEIASYTTGEAIVDGVMIDTNSDYPIESNLTEKEIGDSYKRIRIAHELAHKVQHKAMGTEHLELQEWMCDVLAWRMMTDYIGQFDKNKQAELLRAIVDQAKIEFDSNGIENREDPLVRGYRASNLWLMKSRNDSPDLISWKSRLDKVISSLWDPDGKEAKLALELEEEDAQARTLSTNNIQKL